MMPILKFKTSQESIFKIFYYNNRGIRKVKNLQKLSNKETYFTLQIITKTITNLSNSLHGQTLSMNTLFSPLIHRAKVLPTGLKNVPMVILLHLV